MLHVDPQKSRIKPNWYPPIFIGCDVFSILLQAGGGGAAAAETETLVLIGDKMIVAGISFQIATMTICGALAVDYAVRVWAAARKEGVNPLEGQDKLKKYIVATALAFVFIYIRCVYRVAEMVCYSYPFQLLYIHMLTLSIGRRMGQSFDEEGNGIHGFGCKSQSYRFWKLKS